jgi:hypothetical protein
MRTVRFTDTGHDLLFENISLDSNGDLVMTWDTDGTRYNPVVNAILIEAIPEPVTLGMIGTGGLVLFIRRRFMV